MWTSVASQKCWAPPPTTHAAHSTQLSSQSKLIKIHRFSLTFDIDSIWREFQFVRWLFVSLVHLIRHGMKLDWLRIYITCLPKIWQTITQHSGNTSHCDCTKRKHQHKTTARLISLASSATLYVQCAIHLRWDTSNGAEFLEKFYFPRIQMKLQIYAHNYFRQFPSIRRRYEIWHISKLIIKVSSTFEPKLTGWLTCKQPNIKHKLAEPRKCCTKKL